MTTFQISAPGRVFLCGEHTVMHGKQVVAASLGLRTTLKFRQLPLQLGIIKIDFPDVDISLDIPLQMIVNFTLCKNYSSMINDYPYIFLGCVRNFITFNGLWRTNEQRVGLQIFFFLLLVIAPKEELDIQPFHVHLTTKLKMSAGLGSPTSFATCLAACFLYWSCLQKDDHNGFTPEELKRISEYVMSSEEEYTETYEFNQDHMICTYGRVTAYKCIKGPLNVQSEIINTPEMYIFLADAKICLDKKQQMLQLAVKANRDRIAVDDLLDKINNISEEVVQILHKIRENHQRTNRNLQLLESLYKNIQDKLFSNQNSLRELDLSHPNIDSICSIAGNYGFKGKCAGNGTGDVIILLPESTEYNNRAFNLVSDLLWNGFSVSTTTVSCTGVRLDQVH
ncbi:Mevalonate kinase [Camponotus floridanus]|uniref:Mevalonate kinase n=1 Tax=Camponotus floridanus TaxID=104421 RepID=E2AW65_CAMFO|nr:Mevalonate kinase [Camponotus floridanus]